MRTIVNLPYRVPDVAMSNEGHSERACETLGLMKILNVRKVGPFLSPLNFSWNRFRTMVVRVQGQKDED